MEDHKKNIEEAMESLKLAELLEKLEGLDLEQIRRDKMKPVDRLVEDLKTDSKLNRGIRKYTKRKPKKKRRMHWKTEAKNRREYYRSFKRYRRLEMKAEMLGEGAEGWWKHLNRNWSMHKVQVNLTKDDWVNVVWPALDGNIPVINRYQPALPISLENIYVTNSDKPKQVLFDGKEWALRQAGYIL